MSLVIYTAAGTYRPRDFGADRAYFLLGAIRDNVPIRVENEEGNRVWIPAHAIEKIVVGCHE